MNTCSIVISLCATVLAAQQGSTQLPTPTRGNSPARVWSTRAWAREVHAAGFSPYLIAHQDITLDYVAADPGKGSSYRGLVTTTLVSRDAQLDTVVFDQPGTLVGVTDAAGRTLIATDTVVNDGVIVRLQRARTVGDTIRITLAFTGTLAQPATTHDPYALVDHVMPWPASPATSRGLERLTWDIRTTVPNQFHAVSTGTLVDDRPAENGTHLVHWRQARAAPALGIVLMLVPKEGRAIVREVWRGPRDVHIPIEFYVPSIDTNAARLAARQLLRAMTVFTRLTGVVTPGGAYRVVLDGGGTQSALTANNRGTLTHMAWTLPLPGGYANRHWVAIETNVHELAHQWFGTNGISAAASEHLWLAEGFAEFLTAEYWRAEGGAWGQGEYFLTYPFSGKDELSALVPVPSYFRSAQVLTMLKHYLGDRLFWRGMHAYLTQYNGQAVSTADFQTAMENAAGLSLGWFFDQWVYGAGQPIFLVQAQYDSLAQRVTLTVQQRQRARELRNVVSSGDTIVAVTPEVFRMPVTVRVSTTHGDVRIATWITERAQTIVVAHVTAAPTMIIFDDADAIYKYLSFPQPTSWLINQLARESSPWQMWWVVEQIRRRAAAGESLARDALAAAASQGRQALTRERAMSAFFSLALMFGIPADVDRVMRHALSDSSVPVRQVAAQALAQWPGDDAAPLLRYIVETDANDPVRASALNTAFLLSEWHDTTARTILLRDLLHRALSTPSEHDTLRILAVEKVQSAPRDVFCDAMVVGAVNRLSATYPTARELSKWLAVQCGIIPRQHANVSTREKPHA